MKRLILLIIVLGILAVAAFGAWAYSDLRRPVAHTQAGQDIHVPKRSAPSPIAPRSVLAKLQQGERRLNRLTVIEGWTRWDIARAMAQVPEFKLANEAEALQLMHNVSLISDLEPEAKNLEGYLFPDTYEF